MIVTDAYVLYFSETETLIPELCSFPFINQFWGRPFVSELLN